MKFFRNTHGAVSVFLVIILVPCLLVASIFVDLGRVRMAKAMGESAADLALNSLLTNYDADLKDWYGMIASCQNIDEFYEVSAEFFLRTISSQGMSDEEIFLLSDSFAKVTGDDTIYDLLMIEPQTETSKIIKPVENANLSNPTLIKDSMIEFMKYRAPIELTTNLISRVKEGSADSVSIDALLQADENKPLVDAKQEFYETEGDLLAAAFKSYCAIMDYQDAAKNMGLDNDKLIDYTNKLDNYKALYKEIHTIAIKNLFNTSELSQYTHVKIALDKYKYDKTSSEVYSEHIVEEVEKKVDGKTTKEKIDHYYIDGDKIEKLLSNLNSAITDFEKACKELASAGESWMQNLPGTGSSQAYEIQWWVQMDNAINSSHTTSVENAADAMIKAYAKVLAISDCELRNNIPPDWDSRATELTAKVSSHHSTYLGTSVTGTDAYCDTVKKLEEISTANVSKIKPSYYTVSIAGTNKSLDDALSLIALDLNYIRGNLQERVDELDIAINGKGKWYTKKSERIESLDKLKELADDYETDFDSYNGEANTTQTTMAGEERDEIKDELAKGNISDDINATAVSALKSRLVNIKNELQKVIDAIDSMTYGGTTVTAISDFATFSNLAKGQEVNNNIPYKNGDLESHANTTFSNVFAPNTEHVLVLKHTNDNDYNPNIDPEDASVDCPPLLKQFYEEWKDKDRNKFKEASKDEEKAKEEQEKYVEDEKTKAKEYRGKGQDPVKDFSGDNAYNAGTAIVKNVVSLFQTIRDGNYDHIRDDIYATTYVMEMFSYATFDREGKYSLVEDEKQKELTLDNFKKTYDSDPIRGDKDTEKTWLSQNVKDSYNKTLTNVMINRTNNASYLAEVEYILYGKATNQENLDEAFDDIYDLRYALNLVSCFGNYWGNGAVNTIAGFISAGFAGVIPVAAIKVVMLPIMTAIETCTDLKRLSAGFPVEIYKVSDEEWWLNSVFSTDFSEIKNFFKFFEAIKSGGASTHTNGDKGFYYSDYLMLFVYTGFAGDSKLESDMYKRVAEVIQANLNKKIGKEDKKYSLKKSIMYFELNAQIRVEPLMITLPVFNEYNNGMKTTTNWCTFKVKTIRGYS